jgi:glycosyltransferase involved in cell wall biosynthesis
MLHSCLNLLPHIDPALGGLSTSVPALCASTSLAGGFPSTMAAFCDAGEQSETTGISITRLPRSLFRRDTIRQLSQLIAGGDILHIHGLWQAPSLGGGWLARRHSIPYVVSAHGMLEPWALHHRRWKKSIYASLIERSTLAGAACLRALTQAEADDYRRFGLSNPIAIIPNGVEVRQANPEAFLDAFPELRGFRIILFLGRIHYKKGPDLLVRAWKQIAEQFPDVRLVFAGNDSEGTEATIKRLAMHLAIAGRITFTGFLRGDLKWSALAASSIFVLPSHSEGFSVAIVEALGSARPVVITPQCHFPEVAEQQCGWIVDPDCESLATALTKALHAPHEILEEMGARGRGLVRKRCSWDAIGCQMAEVYRWILGGHRPQLAEIRS